MRFLFLIGVLMFLSLRSAAQDTLFDPGRVSSVYISMHPDSLAKLLEDELSDHYFRVQFIYDYGSGRDTVENAGFRLRGNTSRLSAKKSFKISFNEYSPGRSYLQVKKLNLNGEHNDPTLVREKFFYDCWKNAGMPERRTSFVRLYINGSYFGLYTNVEELDKAWLKRVYGNNTGNLYKCTYPADMVFLGPGQTYYKNLPSSSLTGGRAYDLQTNETADDYSDLVELITLLNQPADSAFAAAIVQKLDVNQTLKAFALDVASGNWDDYMYNKNNYFLYHHPVTGKFEIITYDPDNTFGIDWLGVDWSDRNCFEWYKTKELRPMVKQLLSVPSFMNQYLAYLDTMARLIVAPAITFPHLDSLEALVTDAAVADHYRTLDYGYTVSDFHNGFIKTIDGHSPYGIKPFLEKRTSTLLQQLKTASIETTQAGKERILIYPNPADAALNLHVSPGSIDRKGTITDMRGIQRMEFNVRKNEEFLILDVSGLRAGIYVLVLGNGPERLSTRFVIR
jgi:hypothetical protein